MNNNQTPKSRFNRRLKGLLKISSLIGLVMLSACAPLQSPPVSDDHIGLSTPAMVKPDNNIPKTVSRKMDLPEPTSAPDPETYTVVVTDVPIGELLFTLSRDAKVNLDIDNDISGSITLNAVDQTLTQILDRIARMADIRYTLEGDVLKVMKDTPFLRNYKVEYLNMSREREGTINVSTAVANSRSSGTNGGGSSSSGSNNSESNLSVKGSNQFWRSLFINLAAIIGEKIPTSAELMETKLLGSENIIVNAETGMVGVRANSVQHREIEKFLYSVLESAQRQVMLEVTIAEVALSDRYQAGVQWQHLTGGNLTGLFNPSGTNLDSAPTFILNYGTTAAGGALDITLKALSTFGDVKVLSSPRLMSLNNQAAVLRVTDERVYVLTDVEVEKNAETGDKTYTFTNTVNTVPEGVVLSVTPFVDEHNIVSLNIRPTITRILQYVESTNRDLEDAGVTNRIPEVQVRELETVLRVGSGNAAVIGGLMQDKRQKDKNGLPVVSKIPLVGDLFAYRDESFTKTELVVFIRPLVINDASFNGDFAQYHEYMPAMKDSFEHN